MRFLGLGNNYHIDDGHSNLYNTGKTSLNFNDQQINRINLENKYLIYDNVQIFLMLKNVFIFLQHVYQSFIIRDFTYLIVT